MSAQHPEAAQLDPGIAAFWQAYDLERVRKRRMTLLFLGGFTAAFLASAVVGDLDPVKIVSGLPKLHEFVVKILPTLRWESLGADLAEWFYPWKVWLKLLLDTVLIAFLATLGGFAGALLFCFPASRNLAPNRLVYAVSRRIMEIARTVPELVYALIFVFCFGAGPMAGVLAIGIHTVGALGKLFSEVNENAEEGPIEGVKATGGTWFQCIRLGVLPQVLPNFASYTLLRFEINVRSSSIIGFVGAGGLGEEIRTVIGFNEYESLSALFLIVLLTVACIDIGCDRLRRTLIDPEFARRPAP